MLKYAYPHQEQINKILPAVLLQKKYKYHQTRPYINLGLSLEDSTWSQLAFVSGHEESILGVMIAYISRENDKVDQLWIMNFGEINPVFSLDLGRFLDSLFMRYGFRKIEFSVVIGNPAEKMYDYYVEKYGGRVTGAKRYSVKLEDGKYYNEKEYELFKTDYIEHRKRNRSK